MAFSVTPTSFNDPTVVSDMSPTDSTSSPFSSNTTSFPSSNTTGPCEWDWGCVPAEVAFVVMASVGSLVVFLLASILVLACQVCRLQRQQYSSGRGHTRSNVDLVSGTGYWGAGTRAEGGGIVGPCDASSVMLEEVKAQEENGADGSDFDQEGTEEGSEVLVTQDSRPQSGISVAPVGELIAIGETDDNTTLPPPPPPMPGSTSRESCLEMGKDLEDMPLVV